MKYFPESVSHIFKRKELKNVKKQKTQKNQTNKQTKTFKYFTKKLLYQTFN
jgi:hypothetical protein